MVVSFDSEFSNGNSGSAKTIDFANGNKQSVLITANTTLTFVEPPGVGNYQCMLVMNATGGWTIAFSGISSSRWLGSTTQPDHNTAANGETLWTGYWNGSVWTQSMAPVGTP